MSQSIPKPDSVDQLPAGIRFGVQEVMLLITAFAISFWSYDYTVIFQTARIPDSNTWKAIFRCNYLIEHTLGLIGFLLLIQTVLTRNILRHPGYIFLYYYGFYAVAIIAASFYVGYPKGSRFVEIISSTPPTQESIRLFGLVMNVMIANCVIALFFYITGLIKFRGRWRVTFLLLVAHTALGFYLAWIFRFSFTEIVSRNPETTQLVAGLSTTIDWLAVGTVIFVAVCCVIDRNRRDWKHWLGIVLLIYGYYGTKALIFAAGIWERLGVATDS